MRFRDYVRNFTINDTGLVLLEGHFLNSNISKIRSLDEFLGKNIIIMDSKRISDITGKTIEIKEYKCKLLDLVPEMVNKTIYIFDIRIDYTNLDTMLVIRGHDLFRKLEVKPWYSKLWEFAKSI